MCAYQSEVNDSWEPLEKFEGCEKLGEPLKEGEYACCPRHLSSFVVGQSFEVYTGRFEKTIGALSALNIICLFCVVTGIMLDCKGLLMFGQVVADDKFNANADGAAAVDGDISHNAPSGKLPDAS